MDNGHADDEPEVAADTSSVRYDLAGNPLPPEEPADSTESAVQSAAVASRQLRSRPFNANRSFVQGAIDDILETVRPYFKPSPRPPYRGPLPAQLEGMGRAVDVAGYWMIAVAAITLVTAWLNVPLSGFAGLNLVQALCSYVYGGNILQSVVALAVGALGYFALKRHGGALLAGVVVYACDTVYTACSSLISFSLLGLIVGTGCHAFICEQILGGWQAVREIERTM